MLTTLELPAEDVPGVTGKTWLGELPAGDKLTGLLKFDAKPAPPRPPASVAGEPVAAAAESPPCEAVLPPPPVPAALPAPNPGEAKLPPGMPPVEEWLVCRTKESRGFCCRSWNNCGPDRAALPRNVCGTGAATVWMGVSLPGAGAICK